MHQTYLKLFFLRPNVDYMQHCGYQKYQTFLSDYLLTSSPQIITQSLIINDESLILAYVFSQLVLITLLAHIF